VSASVPDAGSHPTAATAPTTAPGVSGVASVADGAANAPPDAATHRPRMHPLGRWIGWRLRLLIAVALASCLSIFTMTRWLAQTPHLPLQFQPDASGRVQVMLTGSHDTPLSGDTTVVAAVGADGRRWQIPVGQPGVSPRWLVRDEVRERHIEGQRALHGGAAAGPLTLQMADGRTVKVPFVPRSYDGMGLTYWPLVAVAMLLMLVGAVVALARPQALNLLYMLMAACQSLQILLLAAALLPGLGLPLVLTLIDMPLRTALDLGTAAAGVTALALYPRRHPAWRAISGAAWAVAAAVLVASAAGWLSSVWGWLQGVLLGFTLVGLLLTMSARRQAPDPVAAVIGRFVAGALALCVVVTGLLVHASMQPAAPAPWVAALPMAWHLGLALLLMVAPFVTRSRRVMREFALLAGISVVASALDLLFVAVFSLSPFSSLAMVVFLALGVYAGLRHWVFSRFTGGQALTTERIFEQLYRAARDVQAQPAHYTAGLAGLLNELFEPLEITRSDRASAVSRVTRGGAALRVPVRPPAGVDVPAPQSLVLRFAGRGRRIFTAEDALLADRVVAQLRRAVAYDTAVERGRTEERLRIAQDLHDDIGARLLTMMYQAPNREMEDYVRHTLKDLKTLTRGLAASEHRLSHAVAEWKSDLSHRMEAARIDFDWEVKIEGDGLLTMVQWSAITRVLRELATNAIHHAQATRVAVHLELGAQGLLIRVSDNGVGGDPQDWAPGLGLGGVRKRIKLLGGDVTWRANRPRGIVCEAVVRDFTLRV